MSVNRIPLQQNLASGYNNQVTFSNNAQHAVIKADNSEGDSFVSRHKKKIVIASAITGIAALGATVIAYMRGKTLNVANGNGSKFFSNIKEGFKSFFGKGKEAYKQITKKTNTSEDPPETEIIQDVINKDSDNIKPIAPQTAKDRVNKIIQDNNFSTNSIAGDVDNAVIDGFSKLDDEMACAFSDDVIKNLINANGVKCYCGGINFNIKDNLINIRKVYTPEQVKSLCENSPQTLIEALKKESKEFIKLTTK